MWNWWFILTTEVYVTVTESLLIRIFHGFANQTWIPHPSIALPHRCCLRTHVYAMQSDITLIRTARGFVVSTSTHANQRIRDQLSQLFPVPWNHQPRHANDAMAALMGNIKAGPEDSRKRATEVARH